MRLIGFVVYKGVISGMASGWARAIAGRLDFDCLEVWVCG